MRQEDKTTSLSCLGKNYTGFRFSITRILKWCKAKPRSCICYIERVCCSLLLCSPVSEDTQDNCCGPGWPGLTLTRFWSAHNAWLPLSAPVTAFPRPLPPSPTELTRPGEQTWCQDTKVIVTLVTRSGQAGPLRVSKQQVREHYNL